MTERPIKDLMTTLTLTLNVDDTLQDADRVMRESKVRHLPILDGKELVGLVSQTDLHVVEALDGVDPSQVLVSRAMTPLPYSVSPEESLGEVVGAMADNKYGCAVVVEGGSVVGIFTTTDATRVLAEFLGA